MKLNRDAVANLANAAVKLDCLLVHISTDYVFDGTSDHPYTEKDTTNPQSVYGRTKLEGEQAIKKSGCLYIIIRTAWLYSGMDILCENNIPFGFRTGRVECGERSVGNTDLCRRSGRGYY